MTKKTEKTIKAYKGFDKDLKCRGLQYEVGKDYEQDGEIKVCENGFHACEYPLDVFGYYNPANSRYCEVAQSGDMDKDGDESKVSSSKIHISAEVGINEIVEAAVSFIFDRVSWKNKKESDTGDFSAATNTGVRSAATNTGDQSAATNTGDRSAATNTGDRSAATNTGNWSAATNTGNWSAATNTGDRSAATNTGYQSAATNTGYQSAATNTGDFSAATNTGYQSAATNTGYQSAATNTGVRSAATNTGDQSAATNTGDRSAATNTGYRSAATNTGDRSAAGVRGNDSVAIVTGRDSKAKGASGCWLVLTERDEDWHILDVKAVKVDGVKIKADTWYKLVGGEPKEVEE